MSRLAAIAAAFFRGLIGGIARKSINNSGQAAEL